MTDVTIRPGEVEFLPLLKAVPGQMLSRRTLRDYGVEEWMIKAREERSEIVVCGPGTFDSIMLTAVGESAVI